MARAGQRRHLVTLVDRPDSGTPATMSPSTAYASIEQLAGGASDEDHVTYLVGLPYHSQVNTDTVLEREDGSDLFVMSVRDATGQKRDLELVCQEVKTP
jgi:hypothetical protein